MKGGGDLPGEGRPNKQQSHHTLKKNKFFLYLFYKNLGFSHPRSEYMLKIYEMVQRPENINLRCRFCRTLAMLDDELQRQ